MNVITAGKYEASTLPVAPSKTVLIESRHSLMMPFSELASYSAA